MKRNRRKNWIGCQTWPALFSILMARWVAASVRLLSFFAPLSGMVINAILFGEHPQFSDGLVGARTERPIKGVSMEALPFSEQQKQMRFKNYNQGLWQLFLMVSLYLSSSGSNARGKSRALEGCCVSKKNPTKARDRDEGFALHSLVSAVGCISQTRGHLFSIQANQWFAIWPQDIWLLMTSLPPSIQKYLRQEEVKEKSVCIPGSGTTPVFRCFLHCSLVDWTLLLSCFHWPKSCCEVLHHIAKVRLAGVQGRVTTCTNLSF